ncbi:MAG: DNA polymerase III subunit alpha [bacterium]|nr:DNA polymerase III subunit alpha [bacterium]
MKQHKPFVHLHTHSHYSLLDGLIKIPDLVQKARDLQFPAIALTDHGNMFGTLEFFKTCINEGVKPIIGLEAYIAPESRFIKEKISTSDEKQVIAHHLVLLAKNDEGYRNLLELSSYGYLEGFYYHPRIDRELLAKHHKGLIAMSACLKGEIAYYITKNNLMHSRRIAYEMKELFGEDFYLEVQYHKIEEEKKVLKSLIGLSKELNIPLVASNDVHYLTKDDYEAHEILLCIQTQKKMKDTDRFKLSTNEFDLKSYEDMVEIFKEVPEALQNTIAIMDKCNLKIEFGGMKIPKYPVPEDITAHEFLENLAFRGLEKRYGEVTDKLKEQLQYELDLVTKMKFINYFLIVWDYVNFCQKNDIMVGAGRGSAAGSLLAYTLGITDVDPVKYGLHFERFLNPERVSMPDIDIDFEDIQRDKVKEYVVNKYGKEHVASIITFNKFKAKAAFKAVARVMDMKFVVSNEISKFIEEKTLEESYKRNTILREKIGSDIELKKIWEISLKLENICLGVGKHAAGIVISEEPLIHFVPFYKDTRDDAIATQYDMNMINDLGLLKFDLLALKNLSIIKDTIKLVKHTENIDIDIRKIPLDDKQTYKLLGKGDTNGVFQIEKSGMTELFCRVKPKNLEEISVLIALYRPGPLESGMVDSFVKRKNKEEEITYAHKSLKPILEETYGVIVYQEQVMEITKVIGGFSLGEADVIRRIMSKKKPEELEPYKEKFLAGARKNKFDERLAERIFNDMAKFAEYAFNKAHSVAYAFITYQTAYLKAWYPAEYLAAILSNEMDKIENITKHYSIARKFKIRILPPDINRSIGTFNVNKIRNEADAEEKVINFGMAGIKNVGAKLIDLIVEEREKKGEFKNIMDFLIRLDARLVNKKILEGLIKSGAFDTLNMKRKVLMDNMDKLQEHAIRLREEINSNQMSLFLKADKDNRLDYSSIIKEVIKEPVEWPKDELLKYEKEVLGIFLSDHPLNYYKKEVKKYTKIDLNELDQYKDNTYVSLVGLITHKNYHRTQTQKTIAFLSLEDLNGVIEVVVMPELFEKCKVYIEKEMPVLIIRGLLKFNDEKYKIEALEIAPVEEPEKLNIRKVYIKIPYEIAGDDTKLNQVKELMLKNRGNARVELHIYKGENEKIIMEVPNYLNVNPDKNFINELITIIGENSIHLY